MNVRLPRRNSPAVQLPPEDVDDAPLTIDAAAALAACLGFVLFRAPPGLPMADSCLVVTIRDAPTLEHFDPEVVSFWTLEGAHGQVVSLDVTARTPITEAVSWGSIEIRDRLKVSNSFVTFGGDVSAESVGPGEVLVIVRSPAPILRLGGHSQHPDVLAPDAMAFFSRILPHLWDSPGLERHLAEAAPQAIWAAFLLDSHRRDIGRVADEEVEMTLHRHVGRALDDLARRRADMVAAGRNLLHDLGR